MSKYNFSEHGLCIVKNAFSLSDMELAHKEFTSILKMYCVKNDIAFSNVSRSLCLLREKNRSDLIRFQRTISRTSSFYKISSSDNLCKALKESLGIDCDMPLYFTNNGIILSFPRNDEEKSTNINLDWHKDTFFTIPKSRFVHFWAPLFHDGTEDIGSLKICLSSHKDGLGKQVFNFGSTFNYMYSAADGEIDKYEKVSTHVPLGDALLFDSRVWHASGNNTSDNVRITAIGLAHDVGAEDFRPITSPGYVYDGESPEQYFYSTFGGEGIKKYMSGLNNVEQLSEPEFGV